MLGTSAREFSTNLIDIAVAVVLLLGAIVVAFGLVIGLGYYAVVAADSLWLVVSIVLGIGLGIILTVVLVCAVLAIRVIWQRHRHDLTPPAPQIVKVIEQAPPIAVTPPVLSTGVEIQPHMVGEWLDKDDLAWLCRYIALKKDWTARTLEGLPLPKSHLVITNKDGDETHPTTYARLMLLFTGSGLIVNRSDRKTGELTETDPDKMLEKILKRF